MMLQLKNSYRTLISQMHLTFESRWVHCRSRIDVPMPPNHSGYNKPSAGYTVHSYNSWSPHSTANQLNPRVNYFCLEEIVQAH